MSQIKENSKNRSKLTGAYVVLLALLIAFGCQPANQSRKIMLESMPAVEEVILAENVQEQYNTEEYDRIYENEFLAPTQNPLSTFSIDVDNAAYSNIRRFLNYNQLPPKDAVRIEEMVNYFSYDYPQPGGEHPFEVYTELGECPWAKGHYLAHIGIQGKSLDYENLKPSNLVFLLDVSGSMASAQKLGLVKHSMELMLNELSDEDKISIVVYAGAAGVVLPPTPATEKWKIKNALRKLKAGGSTAGGEGIELAYKLAKENLLEDGNNRVILCTDGDFNVGASSTGDLVRLIEEKRKDNIYLTICGYGMGNYKDGRMEQISNAGNGNYFYIDNIKEAEKVFVKELRANMFTIAKDVKIQVEFNPKHVKSYRLIGYENRMLAKEDFNDDMKDAGELGAGHTVTAIYEIVPHEASQQTGSVDDLKYQHAELTKMANSSELFTLKLRYKPINSNVSKLIATTVKNNPKELNRTSDNYRFSASVAAFGMQLRDSKFKGNVSYNLIEELVKNASESDPEGYKQEFKTMVETAKLLAINSNE